MSNKYNTNDIWRQVYLSLGDKLIVKYNNELPKAKVAIGCVKKRERSM